MYCCSQCQIGILTDTFKILWNIYDRGFLQKLLKISQQSTYSNPQSLYFEKCDIGMLKILESVFLEQNIWFLATFSNLSVVLVRLSVAPHPLSTRCILHYMSAGSPSDVVCLIKTEAKFPSNSWQSFWQILYKINRRII